MSDEKTECSSCRCTVGAEPFLPGASWRGKPILPCGAPATTICAEHLADERRMAKTALEERDRQIAGLREQLHMLARSVETAEKARGLLAGETLRAFRMLEPNTSDFSLVYPRMDR